MLLTDLVLQGSSSRIELRCCCLEAVNATGLLSGMLGDESRVGIGFLCCIAVFSVRRNLSGLDHDPVDQRMVR